MRSSPVQAYLRRKILHVITKKKTQTTAQGDIEIAKKRFQVFFTHCKKLSKKRPAHKLK
jgi:phage-related protein